MPAEPSYVPGMPPPALMTAEQLLELNIPNKRTELVRGVLIVREPAGHRHGRVAFELGRRLGNHVAGHQLGAAYAAGTGFTLARRPAPCRAPAVAFGARGRLPRPRPGGSP